jgi:hypothetical protein
VNDWLALGLFLFGAWVVFIWIPQELERAIRRKGIRRAWEAQERAKARIWAQEMRNR